MAETQAATKTTSGKEQIPMLQSILLLAFCLFVGLVSLAIFIWVVLTGQLFTLDGLLLVAIGLTIGGFFLGNFAWSIYTGEVREVLNNLRSKGKGADTKADSSREGRA